MYFCRRFNLTLVELETHFDADILMYYGLFEGLEIDDYSDNKIRRNLIRSYYELLSDFVVNRKYPNFIHTRKFI